jgi:hypothetical protein
MRNSVTGERERESAGALIKTFGETREREREREISRAESLGL